MSDMDAFSLNDGVDYGAEFDWRAEQRRDLEERHQRAIDALKIAESYGVPREQIEILASEAGVQYP